MSTSTEQITQDERRPRRFRVTVNNHAVVLTDHKMTGLEIKQAAIEQGAAIEVRFQLSVKVGHRYQVVRDDKEIAIHEGQEFLAVAPDDNS